MDMTMSARGVLALALEMEETGQVFFEVVASGCGPENQRVAQLLMTLARDEADHLAKFRQMLEKLDGAEGKSVKLTKKQQDFVRKLLKDKVLPDPIAARQVAEVASPEDALDLAIEMERNSVRLYGEILMGMSDEADKRIIENVIEEEKSHERGLSATRKMDLSR